MFPMRDLSNLQTQIEGQYFERKPLWEGPPERRKTRDRRAVRDPLSQLVFRNLLHHFELTKEAYLQQLRQHVRYTRQEIHAQCGDSL